MPIRTPPPTVSVNKRPSPSTPDETRARPRSPSYHPTLSQSASRSWSWSPRRSPPPAISPSTLNRPSSATSTDSRRTSTISACSPKSRAPIGPGRESRSSPRLGSPQGIESAIDSGSSLTSGSRLSVTSILSMGSGASMLFAREEPKEEIPVLSPMTVPRPTVATSPHSAMGTLTSPAISTPAINTTTLNANLRRPTRVKIKIRDFAFENSDDRYRGMGTDVPKPNRFARLNKKLGGSKKAQPTSRRWSNASESMEPASAESSDISDDNEEDPRERNRIRFRGRFSGFLDDDDDDDDDWTI